MTRFHAWLRRPEPVTRYTPLECAVYVVLVAGCAVAMALAYAA